MKVSISTNIAGNGEVVLDGTDVYFALRSYTDGGEHYAGQIGSESSGVRGGALVFEVGKRPTLQLDVVAHSLTFAGEVLVDVQPAAREALIAAGWTPPA